MQLDAAPHEQRVVRDLLDHRVLEAVTPLTPLTRSRLEHQVRPDQVVDRLRESRAAGLAEDPVAEALADHRGELDALPRGRLQPVDARGDDRMKRRRHLEGGGPLAELPLTTLVARDGAGLDQRADGLLDEEGVAARAADDLVAQLVGEPVERRLDDPGRLLVGERLEDELGEVRSDRTRLRRARARALREQKEDWDPRGPRRDEPEELKRRGVGEVQILEHVEQRTLACERGDDVVDDDEHRALPLFGVARGLGRSGEVEELA